MTLDIAAVLSCPGNPVDALRATPAWGGVGIHSHRYKRDGDGGTGQETSVTTGSHTHTHTGSPWLGNPVGRHHSVATLHGDSAEGHTGSRTCS